MEPIFLQQWELEAVDISAVESPACRFMDVSCQDARSSSERDDALEVNEVAFLRIKANFFFSFLLIS